MEKTMTPGLIDNVWNDIWRSDKYSNPHSRYEKASYKINLFQQLGANLNEVERIGDWGCGGGYFAKTLSAFEKGDILAMDISPVAINIAKNKNNNPRIEFRVADAILSWKYQEYFDAIFLVGLIEHIEKPESVLENAYNALKTGGKMFICSSNKHSVFHLEKCILELCGRWRLGYQKDFRLNELLKFLTEYQFNIKRYHVSGCIRKANLLSLIDRFLSRVMGWGRYIFIIAEKE
ncbi:MAG: class I SAM-dependent methyltransferase [Desulfobacteraceae bacterium]|nr:class I SAM-dependent methyltransferase [Desulfobacteraceae bacterium]